jgi:hypothetical protein
MGICMWGSVLASRVCAYPDCRIVIVLSVTVLTKICCQPEGAQVKKTMRNGSQRSANKAGTQVKKTMRNGA